VRVLWEFAVIVLPALWNVTALAPEPPAAGASAAELQWWWIPPVVVLQVAAVVAVEALARALFHRPLLSWPGSSSASQPTVTVQADGTMSVVPGHPPPSASVWDLITAPRRSFLTAFRAGMMLGT
jgi:hypothetical protein